MLSFRIAECLLVPKTSQNLDLNINANEGQRCAEMLSVSSDDDGDSIPAALRLRWAHQDGDRKSDTNSPLEKSRIQPRHHRCIEMARPPRHLCLHIIRFYCSSATLCHAYRILLWKKYFFKSQQRCFIHLRERKVGKRTCGYGRLVQN